MIPATHRGLLSSTAHVATIGAAGEPQSSPVWFDWDDTYLRFAQVSGSINKRSGTCSAWTWLYVTV